MSRRDAAAVAATQASEAARVLQARSQAARQDTLHLPKTEAAPQPEPASPAPAKERTEAIRKLPRGNNVQDTIRDEIRLSRPGMAEAEAAAEAPAPEPTVLPDPVHAEPVQAAPTEAVSTEPTEPVKTVKVKVDGVESEVPEAEVEAAGGIKSYQIQKASLNRLEKANEALAQTRQATEAALRMIAQASPQPQAQPAPSDADFIKAKLAAIRYGTDEEGAAAFMEAISRNQPNQNLIIAQATTNMKRDLAHSAYLREFNDVLANPVLKIAAETLERQALAQYVRGDQVNWQALGGLDWQGFYSTIGNQVRGAVPRQSQPQPPQAVTAGNTSQSPSDREARKASIVEPPKAAAARAAMPEEQKPPTREESLNEMRRARGQALQ